MSDTDTRYFDSEFTGRILELNIWVSVYIQSGESVELTPPDNFNSHLISSIPEDQDEDEPGYFDQVQQQQHYQNTLVKLVFSVLIPRP